MRQEVEDLRALGYPKGDEAKLSKIWDDADVQEHTKEALAMEGSPFDEVDKALEEYAARLSEVRKSLDREIEARLKWLDQQPPDVIERN